MATDVSPLNRITLAIEPPVARITLNNSPVNVIDMPMMQELTSVLAEIESDAQIYAIVLRGDGDNFSAGVDVAAHTPDKVNSMVEKLDRKSVV